MAVAPVAFVLLVAAIGLDLLMVGDDACGEALLREGYPTPSSKQSVWPPGVSCVATYPGGATVDWTIWPGSPWVSLVLALATLGASLGFRAGASRAHALTLQATVSCLAMCGVVAFVAPAPGVFVSTLIVFAFAGHVATRKTAESSRCVVAAVVSVGLVTAVGWVFETPGAVVWGLAPIGALLLCSAPAGRDR